MIDPTEIVMPESNDAAISKAIDGYVRDMRANPQTDERGLLRPKGHSHECLIRCSKKMLEWSADRFKVTLSTLKANGCKVEFGTKQPHRFEEMITVTVRLGEADLTLRIDEPTTRQERPLTATEQRKKAEDEARGWSFWRRDPWIYTPTGKPKLIYGYCLQRIIHEDIRPLVSVLLNSLHQSNEEAIARRRDQRSRRARYLLQIRQFRKTIWQEQQLVAIQEEAKQWESAERLRQYLARVDQLPKDEINLQWLVLAEDLINQIDPIASGRHCSLVALPRYAEIERIWQERRQKSY